jgi:threonine/homoserine/homoserine lactone efflux protein
MSVSVVSFNVVLLVALASVVLVAIPGPNVIYIATRSLGQGRRAGVTSAFGVETGALVHLTAATVGLSALIRSSPVAFDVVKYLGAAYLIGLGVRVLVRGQPLELEPSTAPESLRRAYGEGVLVSVLNPKIALFFVAFLPQFVEPSRGSTALQILLLGLIFVAIATVMDMGWAFAAGGLGAWLRSRPSFARRQRFLTGGIYVALGAAAALTGSGRRRP